MPDMYLVGLVIILALCFDFINGFHDTANAIATCVATRALSPKIAIMMSAFLNFVGAMISTGVAKTIGGRSSPHRIWSTLSSLSRRLPLRSSGIYSLGVSGCRPRHLMH